MRELLKRMFNLNLNRDNNYYFGFFLLIIGISSIFWYLKFDLFEPLSFLITFLIVGWGFVLLWKSDDDLRFQQAQDKINQLEIELNSYRSVKQLQSRILKKYRGHRFHKRHRPTE